MRGREEGTEGRDVGEMFGMDLGPCCINFLVRIAGKRGLRRVFLVHISGKSMKFIQQDGRSLAAIGGVAKNALPFSLVQFFCGFECTFSFPLR